ncbi:MAG: metalloregulator ArsR/SmtB family transcription factor [Firmicutes bacterium]|nr:metalloregulator ArsR/SmtB family transcription factor [Bacillota bacterium]
MELIQVIKALGDETRIRILNILRHSEACVGEIEHLLGIQQSNASRHLNKLSNAGMITYQKKAQWVYYQLNEKILTDYPFIKTLLDHELDKIQQYQEDSKRFRKYKQSGMTCEQLKEKKNCF